MASNHEEGVCRSDVHVNKSQGMDAGSHKPESHEVRHETRMRDDPTGVAASPVTWITQRTGEDDEPDEP